MQTLVVVIIIVVVLILAIAGLGWNTFFGGVKQGAEKLGVTPIIKNVTEQGKEFISGIATNTTKEVMNEFKSSINSNK